MCPSHPAARRLYDNVTKWNQTISRSGDKQSNLWWISSNWKSPVLLQADNEKNNSHQQEEETMSNVTVEERGGEDAPSLPPKTPPPKKKKSEGWDKRTRFVHLRQLTGSCKTVCAVQDLSRIHHEPETKTICCVNEKAHETWQSADASGTRLFSFSLVPRLSRLAEPDD